MTRWTAVSSSVGTKVLIAVTGIALFLYLVLHLAGNLLLFFGPDTYNGYAHLLLTNPLLVPAEIGLATLFVIHIYKAVVNWFKNRRTRPDAYYKKKWAGPPSRKSLASTTMIWTGSLMALFVIVHVKMFTFGHPGKVAHTDLEDLYGLVASAFHNPGWVVFYEVALVLVGFHLWHGFASAFDSLGIESRRFTPRLLLTGKILAVLVAGGFFLIPLWVYFAGGRP